MTLTPPQLQILQMLARRTSATAMALSDHVYGHLPECDVPDSGVRVVQVQICRIRKLLAERGITLHMRDGHRYIGHYYFAADDKAKVQAILDEYTEPVERCCPTCGGYYA